MSIEEILKVPYVMFVWGMLTAPQVDYEKGKQNKEGKVHKPKTQKEEIAALNGFLQ